MSDVPVDLFVSAQDAQLAMWTAYCDKKMECDDLSEQLAAANERIAAEREVSDKLATALQRIAKLRIVEVDEILDDYVDVVAKVAAIRAGGK